MHARHVTSQVGYAGTARRSAEDGPGLEDAIDSEKQHDKLERTNDLEMARQDKTRQGEAESKLRW
jgi:hypothetical protein